MPEVDITEIDELDAQKVSGVGTPANGDSWVLLKSTDVRADPENPHTESPEADAIETELTKASGMGFCGTDDCSICLKQFGPFYETLKAKLKAAQRRALPDSDFAIPGKAPESGSYPVNDENHAHAALSMVAAHGTPEEQRKVKAKVRAKYPNIQIAKMSPGVPAYATATPKERGHLNTGQSGLAGPVTAGAKNPAPAESVGGKSPYIIPDEAKVKTNPPANEPWQIEVVEKTNWVSLDGSGGSAPGSPEWETFDADSLDCVARGLASAARTVDSIRKRELTEAISGDPSDWFDAYQLDCAKEDICSALAMVAALAYHEAAEGGAMKAIRDTRDHLSKLLGEGKPAAGDGTTTSEEENIMATVTKEELDQSIASAVQTALKADRKVQKAKMKAKMKGKKMPMTPAEMAEKNANNGGDVTQQTMEGQVHGEHEANDVNSVPDGGHVDSQYVNKQKKSKKNDLEKALAKVVAPLQDQISKAMARPRLGGPSLDGQARGAFPASEGRLTAATKGVGDPEIERLEKALETELGKSGFDARDRASQLGAQLTLERLRKAHQDGTI